MPLDQILKDEEFPETERLLRSTGLKHLNQVADRKGMNIKYIIKIVYLQSNITSVVEFTVKFFH